MEDLDTKQHAEMPKTFTSISAFSAFFVFFFCIPESRYLFCICHLSNQLITTCGCCELQKVSQRNCDVDDVKYKNIFRIKKDNKGVLFNMSDVVWIRRTRQM